MRGFLFLGAALALVLLLLPGLGAEGRGPAGGAAPLGRGETETRARAELVSAAADPEAGGGVSVRVPVGAPETEPPGPPLSPEPAARLFVHVFDRASGRALAGDVELWRLGLPEDERFTAGDALEATVEVPVEGLWVEDLPHGRYRAFVKSRRSACEDPPEFRIDGPEARVALGIDPPRLVRLTVDLRDLDGRPIERVRAAQKHKFLHPDSAPFAKQRYEKGLIGLGGGVGGRYGGRTHGRWVDRGPDGFDGGLFRERTPGGSTVGYLRFLPDGTDGFNGVLDRLEGGGANFAARFEPEEVARAEPLSIQAVLAPSGHFDTTFLLPDGTYAARSGALIYATCEPLVLTPGGDPEPWRGATLRVRCTLVGYRAAELDWRPAEGPPPVTVLEPK